MIRLLRYARNDMWFSRPFLLSCSKTTEYSFVIASAAKQSLRFWLINITIISIECFISKIGIGNDQLKVRFLFLESWRFAISHVGCDGHHFITRMGFKPSFFNLFITALASALPLYVPTLTRNQTPFPGIFPITRYAGYPAFFNFSTN